MLLVGPGRMGRGWDDFLASAFNSLGNPHSQPWHLVLAASPGLVSLGERHGIDVLHGGRVAKERLREKGRM